MQPDEFLDVLHAVVERQFQATEEAGYHLFAEVVVVVEGPSRLRLPPFAPGFADVVKQGGPAQPQVVALAAHVVDHLERVVEIVFVRTAVARLDAVQGGQFGQDEGQQAAAVEVDKAARRRVGSHYFIKLVDDAFTADDADALAVTPERLESLVVYLELQLRGKAHGPHHAEGVVAERDVGVERRTDEAVAQVPHALERVDQLAATGRVQANGHGVDGEIATVLVVLEGAVLHHRLARVVAVAFLARTDELDFLMAVLHLRRTEVAEHRKVGTAAKPGGKRLGHAYAAADNHDVNVVGRALQKQVAYVTAHQVALQPQRVGSLRKQPEHRGLEPL